MRYYILLMITLNTALTSVIHAENLALHDVLASSPKAPDKDDPNFERYRERLREAYRFEITRDCVEFIDRYLRAGNLSDAQYTYNDVRRVLAEFQPRGAPLPFEYHDFINDQGIRRLPLGDDGPLSRGDSWRNASPGPLSSVDDTIHPGTLVRESREAYLREYTLLRDVLFCHSLPEILTHTSLDNRKERYRDRLLYLLSDMRFYLTNEYFSKSLYHVAWTPDLRAQPILMEAQQKWKTDLEVGQDDAAHAISRNIKLTIKFIGQLMEFNKLLIAKGTEEALCDVSALDGSCAMLYTDDDLFDAIFTEYAYFQKDLQQISVKVLKILASRYNELPKDSKDRARLQARATFIVHEYGRYATNHDDDDDIIEKALGYKPTNIQNWLEKTKK